MGNFIENTLNTALRHRSLSLQLGLLVLICMHLFGLLGPHSHRCFSAHSKDFGGPHPAQVDLEPELPSPPSEPRPGLHPHFPYLGPDSADQSGKAAEGSPPSHHSTSHYTLDGLEIDPPPPPADEEEYLAICLLVKEVPIELREFINHHYYHHGVRKFYIYDDGSNPPLSDQPAIDYYNVPEEVLNFTYIAPETVPEDQRFWLQDKIMENCVSDNGHKHHWMALLDPDEYVEMRHSQYPILLDWLRYWEYDFERKDTVGALAISWLPHNSGDLDEIPSTGFRNAYTTCVSNGGPDFWLIQHSKSFVRPQFFLSEPNIHQVNLKNETMRFGEQQDDASFVTRSPNTHEYWALHHYGTGSRKYFEQKGRKGRSQGPGMWPVDEAYWDRYHADVTSYTCNEMQKFVP